MINQKLNDTATDIAYVMRWEFPAGQDTHAVKIVNPGIEAILWLSTQDGQPDGQRLRISAGFGDYFEYVPYEERGDRAITVTLTKTPPQIVKDIQRRLLPHYYEVLARAKERRNEHLAKCIQAHANAGTLAQILCAELGDFDEKKTFYRIHLAGDHVWGDFEADGNDEVDIHLTNIPLAVAQQFAAIIKPLIVPAPV